MQVIAIILTLIVGLVLASALYNLDLGGAVHGYADEF